MPAQAATSAEIAPAADLLLRVRLDALQRTLTQVAEYQRAVASSTRELTQLSTLLQDEILAPVRRAWMFLGSISDAANADRQLRDRLEFAEIKRTKWDREEETSHQRELKKAMEEAEKAAELVQAMHKRLHSMAEQAKSEQLDKLFKLKAINLLKQAKKLANGLAASSALGGATPASEEQWKAFATLLKRLERKAFPEYVEVLGGLALRGTGIDNEICHMADHLLRSWDEVGGEALSYSVCIPAAQESLTIGRVIRLGFPEWTIWAVPLCAHEFGQILVDENTAIGHVVGDWAGGDEALRCRIVTYLADAFACSAMGPAYACASILLKFDPTLPEDRAVRAPDDLRVGVITSTLRGLQPPYGSPSADVLSRLERAWTSARALLGPAGPGEVPTVTDRDTPALRQEIVEYVLTEFQGETLLFPADRWLTLARDAEALFGRERRAADPTAPVPLDLRDVLNAAWYSRVYNPDPTHAADVASLVSDHLWPRLRDVITSGPSTPSRPINPAGPLPGTSYGSNVLP